MSNIKKAYFYISEEGGDDELAIFIESCHQKFFESRMKYQTELDFESEYVLGVKVEVELMRQDLEEIK